MARTINNGSLIKCYAICSDLTTMRGWRVTMQILRMKTGTKGSHPNDKGHTMSKQRRANGRYASGQVELAVRDALSATEALDAQTIWQRVRSRPYAPDVPLKTIYNVL